MNSPATARRGSRLSWLGMIVAVAAALTSVIHDATITTTGWVVLSVGGVGGAAVGLVMARRVKMTNVPQVVSIFNAVGGGAAALVAAGGFVRLAGGPGISSRVMIATVLDIIIGPVTFSGSLIAAGKLQGWVSSRPVVFPGARSDHRRAHRHRGRGELLPAGRPRLHPHPDPGRVRVPWPSASR